MSRRTKRQAITALAYAKNGRLLAVGRNSYIKTHPLMAKYARRVGKRCAIYLHAEIDALIKARSRGDVHRLVVVRKSAAGNELCAKPCDICQQAIKDFGVKHVEHT